MTKKPHILHVGFNSVFKRAADFENYTVSVIVHTFIAEKMDKALKDQFAGFGVLDIPHNMNLNEYDAAMDQMTALVDKFVAEFGPLKAIVGLYEHVTLPAAKLRERYGVAGGSIETATLCRDKVQMKHAMIEAGVKVPKFMAVGQDVKNEDVAAFLADIPGKVVLKPRSQAASEGVHIFENTASCLQALAEQGFEDEYEIEEFIEGTICHFDGVVRDGKLIFFSAAEYLNTCFDFVHNDIPLVAVTIDDSVLFNEAREFSEKVIKGVKLEDGVFHLEAFLRGNNEIVFLEIGNRFGGAGVSPMMEKVYGVDLIDEAVRADVGAPSKITVPFTILNHEKGMMAAWLYTPIAVKEKCRVRGISGLDVMPASLFYSELPTIGQWYNEYLMAFPASGRFFVKAPSSSEVKRDCNSIIEKYRVHLLTESEWPV